MKKREGSVVSGDHPTIWFSEKQYIPYAHSIRRGPVYKNTLSAHIQTLLQLACSAAAHTPDV